MEETKKTGLSGDSRKMLSELSEANVQMAKAVVEKEMTEEAHQVIYRFIRVAIGALPLNQLLEKAIREIFSIEWLKFEPKGAIFLYNREAAQLELKAQVGLTPAEQELCARIPLGRCLCGMAASLRKPLFVDCMDKRHVNRCDEMAPHGHYCVPILDRLLSEKKDPVRILGEKRGVVGVMCFYVKEGSLRDERADSFLGLAADVLGGVIERKRTEEILEKSLAELSEANMQLVRDFVAKEMAEDVQKVIFRIVRVAMRGASLETVLEQAVRETVSVVWFKLEAKGAVFLFNRDASQLELKAQIGFSPAEQKLCAQVPLGRCSCGSVAASRRPLFVGSSEECQACRAVGTPPQSRYVVPILNEKKELTGVMCLFAREGFLRDEWEMEFLGSIASILGDIIEHRQNGATA